AAGAGEHPVQQDQVGHLVGDRLLGLAGVARMDRLVVALAHGEGDHVADGGFVVDDEDALLHAVTALATGFIAIRRRFGDKAVTVSSGAASAGGPDRARPGAGARGRWA